MPLTRVPAAAAVPATATTSAGAKQIANVLYQRADQVGGQLAPAVRGAFLDRGQGLAAEPADVTLARGGPSPVAAFADRLEETRGQPMSLASAQGIDQQLGDLIDGEFKNGHLSSTGKTFLDLQTALRDQIRNAGPDDTVGGTGGFDALNDARTAWAQAAKMGDLERIQTRANLTDNPATGIKSGIRTLLSNPARARGYSPDEIQALKAAGERGVLGGALHVFGSRLAPLVAGGIGFGAEGPVSAAAAALASHAGSTMMRNAATALQSRRINNAMNVLGSKVPRP